MDAHGAGDSDTDDDSRGVPENPKKALERRGEGVVPRPKAQVLISAARKGSGAHLTSLLFFSQMSGQAAAPAAGEAAAAAAGAGAVAAAGADAA